MYQSKIYVGKVDERIKKILEDIKNRDSTFVYEVTESEVILKGEDKNQLHKRSLWIVKKAHIGEGYNITFIK